MNLLFKSLCSYAWFLICLVSSNDVELSELSQIENLTIPINSYPTYITYNRLDNLIYITSNLSINTYDYENDIYNNGNDLNFTLTGDEFFNYHVQNNVIINDTIYYLGMYVLFFQP